MRNQPFCGTVVPIKHFQKDRRVQSLMIEINRWLHLAEDYSVDSERSEMLVKILRRVGEMLEGDWSVDRRVRIRFSSTFMF